METSKSRSGAAPSTRPYFNLLRILNVVKQQLSACLNVLVAVVSMLYCESEDYNT